MTLLRLAVATCYLALACAVPPPARLPDSAPLVLRGSDGAPHDVRAEIARSKFTVFVFYSHSCPCLRVHEPRLWALAADYRPRGVSILLVDSEVGASAELDQREARDRAYPVPLLTDPGARLAKSLRAEFATHSVIVDATGNIRYSGGIDSDKNHLRADTRPYLRQALDELLAGREPAARVREPLGCALELD